MPTRRRFMQQSFGTAALLGAPAVTAAAAAAPRPNLLFVFPDQLRAQALGYMGEEPVRTPHLDALEKQSVNLTQAVSNYPMCVPFRTILMSGRYPLANGVLINCFRDGVQMPESHVWWSDLLSQNGYATAYIGKWHISLPPRKIKGRSVAGLWLPKKRRHGFDRMLCACGQQHMTPVYCDSRLPCDRTVSPQRWSPEFETDRAIEYLENRDGTQRDPAKPFALVIGFNPPHTPYALHPAAYDAPYAQTDVEQLCAAAENVPPADTLHGRRYRKNVLPYYGAVTGIDTQIGRLMQCLKAQGLEQNTLVVFTSDHGDCQGRHGEHTKNNPYEEAMRIPLLLRWPAKLAPRRDPLLISVADLYPTLMSLLGIRGLPAGLEGTDLSQTLLTGRGPRPVMQPYYCFENGSDRCTATRRYGRRGLRTERFKLALTATPKGLTDLLLFDLRNDPHECRNLAADHPTLVRDLALRFLRPWLEKTHDPWLENLRLLPREPADV